MGDRIVNNSWQFVLQINSISRTENHGHGKMYDRKNWPSAYWKVFCWVTRYDRLGKVAYWFWKICCEELTVITRRCVSQREVISSRHFFEPKEGGSSYNIIRTVNLYVTTVFAKTCPMVIQNFASVKYVPFRLLLINIPIIISPTQYTLSEVFIFKFFHWWPHRLK